MSVFVYEKVKYDCVHYMLDFCNRNEQNLVSNLHRYTVNQLIFRGNIISCLALSILFRADLIS